MAAPVPQKDDVERWTVEQVAAWLQQVQLSECCDTFLRKGIDGHRFLQLPEEDLKLWGRDVSTRTRRQILKLVSQIKNLQQCPSASRPSIELHPSTLQQDITYDSDYDEFTDEEDENETNPVPQVPLVQQWEVQGDHSPVRPPFPIPRNQQKEVEDQCEEDLYLNPIEPSAVSNHSGLASKGHPGFHQLPFPNTARSGSKGQIVSMTQNRGRGLILPPGKRGPPLLPHGLTTSCSKIPPDSLPLPPRPKITTQSSIKGRNSNQIANENEGSGSLAASFLHSLQESKGKINRNKGPAWMTTPSQVKTDHVYETVDTPVTTCGLQNIETSTTAVPDWQSSARPPTPPLRNQTQDLSNQDLGSQPEGAFSSKIPASPDSRRCVGGSDTLRSQNQIPHNRLPKAAGGHPQDNQPYVTLDDGKKIAFTPLYQEILEKPYFHLISRDKSKALIMDGEDGIFLIRPSTRSGEPLTLVLKFENRLYNINVRQRADSFFALGTEKPQEKTFPSVDLIVSTYTRGPLKLGNGKIVFLKYSPPKKNSSVYVKF